MDNDSVIKDLELDLGLGTSGPEQNFESTIYSSRDKHTHERERGDQSEVNFTDSDSANERFSISSISNSDQLSLEMYKDPASNLRGRTSETKEHLESSIHSSEDKLTLGREQGKWVVEVIDSDGRSTEKHLTIKDIKKDTDYKIVLEFGPYNEPEGGSGGLFGMWLGKLCSDHPFGLTYRDWRNVEKQKKDHVWKVIQDKFDFDASNEEYKKSVMKSLCAKAKHYKNKLWRDCLLNKERPKNISEQEWQVFVSLQSTEKAEKLRERNKKSRSHHKEPHKLGTKSFARTAKELVTKTGKLPSRTEIMNCSHQEANGNFVSEEAPHKSVTLKKRKKIVGVESIRNVPIASSSAPHQNPKDDPAMLLTALQQANDKIAALEQSQAAYKQKMQAESEHYEHLLRGVCWIQHYG